MRCHSNKKNNISSHIHLYLLKMTELKEYHPHVYKKFMEGVTLSEELTDIHKAKDVGQVMIDSMVGKSIYEL